MARFTPASGIQQELDPVAAQRLDDLGLTFATDAEVSAAVTALQAADALKQDAASAATDAELAAAKATIEAAMATDDELAAAVASWSSANALKQDAATAATDAELAALRFPAAVPAYMPGRWYPPQGTVGGAGGSFTVDREYLLMMAVGRDQAFDALGFIIGGTAANGSTAHMALRQLIPGVTDLAAPVEVSPAIPTDTAPVNPVTGVAGEKTHIFAAPRVLTRGFWIVSVVFHGASPSLTQRVTPGHGLNPWGQGSSGAASQAGYLNGVSVPAAANGGDVGTNFNGAVPLVSLRAA